MFVPNDAESVIYQPTIIPAKLFVKINNIFHPLKVYADGVNCYSVYLDNTHIGLYSEQNIRGINVYGII